VNPIIVCGTGRSGTSLFTQMLGRHPVVWAFRWESQIFSGIPGLVDLLDSTDPAADVARFCEAAVGRMYKRSIRGSYSAGIFEIVDLPIWKMSLGVFRTRFLAARSRQDRAAACRSLTGSLFVPAMRRASKTRWAEKTPRNLLCAVEIAEIHPRCVFINVVRDGRDVVSSVLEKKFWPVARSARYPATVGFAGEPVFDKAVDYWNTLIDIGRAQEARLGPQRWLNIRLEDIVREPQATLTRVCEFLRINADLQAVEAMIGNTQFTHSHENRWRTDLSPQQVDALTRVSESNLRYFGYL
jgi:hypothetical protein